MRSLLAVALVATLSGPATALAADPTFTTFKLPGADGRQEPRIAVSGDDVRWADALLPGDTGSAGQPEILGHFAVWKSLDGGLTWQKTKSDPPQKEATIDVDVVTIPMPNGKTRILASELDYAGLNFPTAYSDNGGDTWTASSGSTDLADQDRQWFAVGKPTAPGKIPPVYLLYHNLASGVAQHNMWVATSTDGGQSFGVPVPIAQPGSDAYQDLQCSDSGGPSNITVNPDTGQIYAFFTTRAAPIGPVDTGGCGTLASLQPPEFNIVNGTRVWVATSKDGSPGSWSDSLAVDDATTGQVVSMQLAYGALDNAGNVYVAYPESPNPYPDLEGAGIKLTWQKPDADGNLPGKWSKPTTLVAPVAHAADSMVGGADLVHMVAGDPGKIAVAYYYGDKVVGPKVSTKTNYYSYILQSFDAQSQTPHVSTAKISDIPAYHWSTSAMMGLCPDAQQVGPLQGIYAGLNCPRSTDVWGIALDSRCRVMSTWTTDGGKGDDGSTGGPDGTYVTTQTGGPDLCSSPSSLPGGSQAISFQPAPDSALPGEPGSPTNGSSGGG